MSRKVKLTLLRDVNVHRYIGDEPIAPLLAGTEVTIELVPGTQEFSNDEGDAGYVAHIALLRGAARVPCDHLDSDYCDCSDGMCSHGGWFWCNEFDGADKITNFCRGDMCRCPSSKVRAEARGE